MYHSVGEVSLKSSPTSYKHVHGRNIGPNILVGTLVSRAEGGNHRVCESFSSFD